MKSYTQLDPALSPTKLALRKIRELKRQLAEARNGQSIQSGEIAVVSMACRFPRRAQTPEAFWRDLMLGVDQAGEVPADRWDLRAYYDADPETPGKMYARQGVFLDHLDLMDPEFFGISPREATWVDPQQRLLLEVSWETLERAGWPVDQIAAETGYFVGWMHNDYQNESSDSLLNLNPYIATGSAGSFLCGRLSYYLGLQGPSLAVDTACSSSLVALHLACQSLLRGECRRALVGGVNAIISPTTNILTCKLKALSPTGRSRAFDAQADGYLRGEGCGVIALRPLADAMADGDPVLGVIRGSAIGHNGFSSGLTAPNPKAQERVIREALQRAGVCSSEIEYLEAHGTGTELGDPIEMQAAAAALGDKRDPSRPLLVGSVKTNIGHLEAAAGMAGLIKVLLAMQHETIPAQLHFEQPNPHIAWDRLPVQVVVEPTPWTSSSKLAGVSAFGMSGANAHVVLASPPTANRQQRARQLGVRSSRRRREGSHGSTVPQRRTPWATRRSLFVLSAKSDEALRESAARQRQWLAEHPQVDLDDVAHTLGVGRRHFEHRAAIVASHHGEALRLFEQVERGGDVAGVSRGQQRSAPSVAWQFTGQGSQYVAMARGLYEDQPAFRAALDQCEQWHSARSNQSLLRVMFEDPHRIHHTSWTQPALFALHMGLARLLQSWGMRPDAVLGHSVGQYAAACVAEVMSWEDGFQLIAERGRLIGQLPPGGAMAAVFASEASVEDVVASVADVSIAAYNGAHVVISGPEAAVAAAVEKLSASGARVKRLKTSHAFHSADMDPALAPFQDAAAQLAYQPARIPLVCNLSGQLLDPRIIPDASYWGRHIRQPVRYADSVHSLRQLGCDVLLELGPQPILTGMAASVWSGAADRLISMLRQDENDSESVLQAMGRLYTAGATPNFQALAAPTAWRYPPRRIVLPTYPFQRRRFWGPPTPGGWESAAHTTHPLLGGKQSLAGLSGESRYESWLSPGSPPWLEDHQVMGDIVVPGAALVEMAMAAAPSSELSELVFEKPLRLASRTRLQTIVREQEFGKTLEVHSSPEGATHWTRHFVAKIQPSEPAAPPRVSRSDLEERCPQQVEPADFYHMMDGLGLHYAAQFQTIRTLRFGGADVLARLEAAADLRGYGVPPTVLDGAFHSLAVSLLQGDAGALFLPAGMEAVHYYRTVDGPIWCHAFWTQAEGAERTANLTLFNEQGEVLVFVKNLKLKQLNRAALRRMSGGGPERLLYDYQWRTTRLPAVNPKPSRFLLVNVHGRDFEAGDSHEHELAGQLDALLQEQGQHVTRVTLADGQEQAEITTDRVLLDGRQSEQWNAVLDHWLSRTAIRAVGRRLDVAGRTFRAGIGRLANRRPRVNASRV